MRSLNKRFYRTGLAKAEVLAVFAVVGLVILILLPVLGRANGISRRIQCLQNLRVMGTACVGYAADNIYLPCNVLWSEIDDGYLNYTILADEAKSMQWVADGSNWIGSGDGDYEDMEDFINFGMLFGQRYLDSGQAFYCPDNVGDERYNHETYFDGDELGSVEYRIERMQESRYYTSMSSNQLKRVRCSYISRNYCPAVPMVYVTSGRVQKMDWVSWERAAREKMYYGYKYAFLADRWTYSSGAMHENKFCNVLYGDGSVGTVVDYQGWVHAMGTGGSYYPVAVGNSEGGFSSWYQAWWILDNNFDWYNATAEDWSKINY